MEGVADFTLSSTNDIQLYGDITDLETGDAVAGADDVFNLTPHTTSTLTGDADGTSGALLIGGDDTLVGAANGVYGNAQSVAGDDDSLATATRCTAAVVIWMGMVAVMGWMPVPATTRWCHFKAKTSFLATTSSMQVAL